MVVQGGLLRVCSDTQIDKVADVSLTTEGNHALTEGEQELVLPVRLVRDAEGGVPSALHIVRQLDDDLRALLRALDSVVGVRERPIGIALHDLDPVLLAPDHSVRLSRGEEGGHGPLTEVLLRREETPDELAFGVVDEVPRTDIDLATHVTIS